MDDLIVDGKKLHADYVDAINSNDTDKVMALLSEDIVFQVAGEPELVGAAAVSEWAASFFEAFEAHYTKNQLAFEASGDLAFDRYTYTARLVGREDGAVLSEHGKGTGIFRRGDDGRWLLIVDSWSPDEPAK